MKLSDHFSLDELTLSQEAIRNKINNEPGVQTLENLKFLASQLEEVRSVLGNRAILISSGYRCATLNSLVGSKPTSAHIKGLAADFTCPSFGSVRDVVNTIIGSDIQYDQIIYEYGRWCHIGFAEKGKAPRLQKLTIDGKGTRVYTGE